MKETTIITSEGEAEVYETVDAFFDAHSMTAWRAKELKLFTDAGFDVTDSSKMMAQLSEDKTSVIVTVAFADQAEKDAILANMSESDPEHDGILTALSEDHLF